MAKFLVTVIWTESKVIEVEAESMAKAEDQAQAWGESAGLLEFEVESVERKEE